MGQASVAMSPSGETTATGHPEICTLNILYPADFGIKTLVKKVQYDECLLEQLFSFFRYSVS